MKIRAFLILLEIIMLATLLAKYSFLKIESKVVILYLSLFHCIICTGTYIFVYYAIKFASKTSIEIDISQWNLVLSLGITILINIPLSKYIYSDLDR